MQDIKINIIFPLSLINLHSFLLSKINIIVPKAEFILQEQ